MYMYDPALQPIVLAKLATWGRLTRDDLHVMLRPEERIRLRDDLLKDLEWEGLVTIRIVGDEPVIAITDLGRAWVERHDAAAGPRG